MRNEKTVLSLIEGHMCTIQSVLNKFALTHLYFIGHLVAVFSFVAEPRTQQQTATAPYGLPL